MNIYCVNKHSVLLLFKSVQIPISLMYWIFLNFRLFYIKINKSHLLCPSFTLYLYFICFSLTLVRHDTFEDPWTYITSNVIGWIKKYLPIKSPERSSFPIPSADHIYLLLIYNNIHDITIYISSSLANMTKFVELVSINYNTDFYEKETKYDTISSSL